MGSWSSRLARRWCSTMTVARKSPVRRWCLRTSCSRVGSQSRSDLGNARSVTRFPSAASTVVPHSAVAACPPPYPPPDPHQRSRRGCPAAHCTRCSRVAAPLLSLVPSPLSAPRSRRPTSLRPRPRPHLRARPDPQPCPHLVPRSRERAEPPRRPPAPCTRRSRIAPWSLARSPLPRRRRRRVLSAAISRRRAAEWRNHPPWPTGRRTR